MTFNSPGNKVIKCSLQEDHIYHKFQCPFTSSIHPWISLPPRKLHSSPPKIHPRLLGHEGTSGTPEAYISGPPKVIYINHHSTGKYMDQKHQNPNTTKGKSSSQNIVSPVERFLYHTPASAWRKVCGWFFSTQHCRQGKYFGEGCLKVGLQELGQPCAQIRSQPWAGRHHIPNTSSGRSNQSECDRKVRNSGLGPE